MCNLLDPLGLKPKPSWEVSVQKCYDGCVAVFEKYPNEIFDLGDNLIDSFKSYIDASKVWNKSNATIMSQRSTDLLETISLLANLGGSPRYCLRVHHKANPKLFVAYRTIVNYLAEYLNRLIVPISAALTDLEHSFDDLFRQFNQLCVSRSNNFNFQGIMRSGRKLANMINVIVDTALNCTMSETIANETFEAIAILVCILFDNFLNIQGAVISQAAVLRSRFFTISAFHYSCLQALDPFIRGIACSMNTMTADIAEGVRDLLASLVENIDGLNVALDTLLGPSGGNPINVDVVARNLLKTGS